MADKQHMQELAAYRFTVENLREHVAELEAERTARMTQNDRMAKRIAELESQAHPIEGVPEQIETMRSELAEEKEAADNWRRLALQFDNHRLQALWHLKRILHADSSVNEYKAAEQFLAAPPLDGEAVLEHRIAALAATQPAAPVPQGVVEPIETVKYWRDAYANPQGDEHFMGHGMVVKIFDDYLGMLAAAPQPPEAAPVQLPEPIGEIVHVPEYDDGLISWYTDSPPPVGTKLYTEQKVRDLLAAHGIKVST